MKSLIAILGLCFSTVYAADILNSDAFFEIHVPTNWELEANDNNVYLLKRTLIKIDMFRLTNRNNHPVCVSFRVTEGYNYQSSINSPIAVKAFGTVSIGTIEWKDNKYPANWVYKILVYEGNCNE